MNSPQTANWRKSTFCNPSNNCLEVSDLPDGGASLRHSQKKDVTIELSKGEWEAFVRGVHAGQFGQTPN
jgi:hypothetical protein